MRKTIYNILILFFLFFISCGPKKVTEEDVQKFIESQYQKNTGEFLYDTTYPFSKTKYVEIYSYPVRVLWDTLENKPELKIDEELSFDTSNVNIKEKVHLTAAQQKELFEIFYNTKCGLSDMMGCFDPRHLIIFYDKNNIPFAHIEICFLCCTLETSDKVYVESMQLCGQKVSDLKTLFRSCGIKYGLKGTDSF